LTVTDPAALLPVSDAVTVAVWVAVSLVVVNMTFTEVLPIPTKAVAGTTTAFDEEVSFNETAPEPGSGWALRVMVVDAVFPATIDDGDTTTDMTWNGCRLTTHVLDMPS
jgi:hypothetical protein